jgi:hypothetical protein
LSLFLLGAELVCGADFFLVGCTTTTLSLPGAAAVSDVVAAGAVAACRLEGELGGGEVVEASESTSSELLSLLWCSAGGGLLLLLPLVLDSPVTGDLPLSGFAVAAAAAFLLLEANRAAVLTTGGLLGGLAVAGASGATGVAAAAVSASTLSLATIIPKKRVRESVVVVTGVRGGGAHTRTIC